MDTVKFRTVLKNTKIELSELEKFIGKEVEITIKEIPNRKSIKREWSCAGSLHLKGQLDELNIRDFAYE